MNTQQLIAAIKAATRKATSKYGNEFRYIDADAFLAAVEGLASVPDSLRGKL